VGAGDSRWNVPSVLSTNGNCETSHPSPRFRMLEEVVTQALRRGTRETVGSLQPVRGSTSRHPAQLS
jgi:hypothetical protein